MAPQTSEVWNHFTECEYLKAKCGYCSIILSTSGGSLSNLKRHMKSKHCTIPLNTNERNATEGPSRTDTVSHIATGRLSGISRPRLDGQSTISSYFSNTKLLNINQQKRVDQQLIKMIVKGYCSFDIVEDLEFQNLLKMLNGSSKLPSRKTVSNSMIPLLYHQTYEKVQALMTNCFAVCLTTDGWTSIKNDSYIGVTAHFIDENASLQSVCLGCDKFEERHTSQNVALFLKNTVQEWRIDNKLAAVVSDNAPNIHISCFAHCINLVVQRGLKNISDIQKKVKTIVEHFKRSSHAQSKLQAMQQQMGLPPLKLKQDVITRWNSTHDMFKRIVEIKDAVVSTLAILQCDVEQLTVVEWQIVECSTNILQIFAEVTTEISSKRYVTLSKILIFIRAMIDTMKSFQNNITIPNEAHVLVTSLLEQLNLRFSGYENNEIVTQAALLYPRFKKIVFNRYNPRKLDLAIGHLKRKVCQVILPGIVLAQLIIQAISLLENIGVRIDVVNSDGASTNRKFWSEFGISGNKSVLTDSFEHLLDPKAKSNDIVLIQVYFPTSDAEDDATGKVYVGLEKLCKLAKGEDNSMGKWNAFSSEN
ncbi:hypothetical protein QTP88_027193 [Uroleucon formosanum]